ncbi:MAG: ABC transporter ATP-binding protein [Anaerolineae bacterium]|nr:MAG: ABC transporter ATP-binding protein [Anaerolineae bacterium]
MGFFSSLDVETYDRQYSDRDLVRRMAKYFGRYKRPLIGISLFLVLVTLASAAVPLLVSAAMDRVQTTLTVRLIWLLGGAVVMAGVLVWFANWIQRRLMARVIGNVIVDVRSDAFRAAMEHDLSFYDEHSSGRILSRITSDTREFGQVVDLVTNLFSQVAQAAILGAVLFAIEPKLMFYLLIYLPFVFLIAIGFRRLARDVTRKGFRAMGNVNAAIKETVSGILVAKNFRQEQEIFNEFDEANQTSYKANLRRGFVISTIFPTLNAVGGIGTAMIVYVGGHSSAAGIITVGAWFLFTQSLDAFWFPILNLSAFWTQLQSGLSAAERAFALIDAEPKVVQVSRNPVPALKGDIRFEKVGFQYNEQEVVLRDFDLHIRPGETVALVGHTGAGKSSIAKLTSRFYEFQSGQVLIDGHDIRSFDLTEYRKQLGIVSQMPFLFSQTVLENIRYARPQATEEEILALANRIGDGEWLETFPDGLHTEVGERGGRLSMGQRQLVVLLRVLVQQPAIFILDEATASIDPFTEWQIQQALNLILKHTTSVLIAHRLSTVKAADRIIVVRQGQIIEEGNHESLLAQEGHYAELYNTYFRHQSLAYVEQSRQFAAGD